MKAIIKGDIVKFSLDYHKKECVLEGDVSISDTYHSFQELYSHRILLFITLMKCNKSLSWKSKQHSDGTSYEGWFIGGMNLPTGQITYHIDDRFWDMLTDINTLEKAPTYDGHSSDDVLKRLNSWSLGL